MSHSGFLSSFVSSGKDSRASWCLLIFSVRRILSVGPSDIDPTYNPSAESAEEPLRKRRRTRGTSDGPEPIQNIATGPMNPTEGRGHTDKVAGVTNLFLMTVPFFQRFRRIQSYANPDGSATSHLVTYCTLEDITKATSLRPEDAVFALKECGLLQRRRVKATEDGTSEDEGIQDIICVSREMVEDVAKARGVKRNMMDPKCVLL
jgi:hypothetical protein